MKSWPIPLCRAASACQRLYKAVDIENETALPVHPTTPAAGRRGRRRAGDRRGSRRFNCSCTTRASAGGSPCINAGHPGAQYNDLDGSRTSRLGADLHFGTLSPLQVESAALDSGMDATPFVRQLAWRELYHHQLFHERRLSAQPVSPLMQAFRHEADDPAAVEAWRQGRFFELQKVVYSQLVLIPGRDLTRIAEQGDIFGDLLGT